MTNNELTTEFLTTMIASRHGAPGPLNAAPYLLKLDTVELRAKAVQRARLTMNLQGYRYSEAVAIAVAETQRIGLAESPDEKYNREMLEREHIARCPVAHWDCPNKFHKG